MPCEMNSLRESWLACCSKASLKKPRMYLSMLIARFVVSFYIYRFSLLSEVRGE
jgi:hypothetical protein